MTFTTALCGPLVVGSLLAATPTPDGDEARRWAERELSDPIYAESEPTFFDRAVRAVLEFVSRLFDPKATGDWGPGLAVAAVVLVVVLVVVGVLIWGRPRSVARSRPATAVLFGESDQRSAAQLRVDAEAAAGRADWGAAIVLRFRALARGLDERALVEVLPGATVHGFARRAARVFPQAADTLDAAAAAFDDVRYLRRPGTSELYRRVVAADEAVADRTPVLIGESAMAGSSR